MTFIAIIKNVLWGLHVEGKCNKAIIQRMGEGKLNYIFVKSHITVTWCDAICKMWQVKGTYYKYE